MLLAIPMMMLLTEWSDRQQRRKMFIIFALIGRLLFAITMMLKSMERFIEFGTLFSLTYTVTLPSTLLGSQGLAICMCFSYLYDITDLKQRTVRVLIINAVYLSTIPVGVLLGHFFYEKVFKSSYVAVFALNAFFVVLAMAWAVWRVEDVIRREGDLSPEGRQAHSWVNMVKLRDINNNDINLSIILLLMLFIYQFQHEEEHYNYLYTQRMFGWTIADFSYFYCFQSCCFFFAAAALSCCSLSDTIDKNNEIAIIAIAIASYIVAITIYFFTKNDWIFYLGAMVGSSSKLSSPVLYSMLSKLVNRHNTSKIFSFIYLLVENIAPLVGAIAYSQIYYHTVDMMPGAFFIFTAFTQSMLLPLLILLKKIHF